MNEHPLKKTLRHLAEEEFPSSTDLWLAIQRQLEGTQTNKRTEMAIRFSNFSRTVAFGAMLVLLTLGLVWVLSNTSPQPAIATTQSVTTNSLLDILPTDSPANVSPTPTMTQISFNFDPFSDALTFEWISGTTSKAEIYASNIPLGQVDFGGIPGGWCDRSSNGGIIAFTFQSPNRPDTLRWVSLQNVNQVNEPFPEMFILGPVTFSPNNYRLVFSACSQDGDCGVYIYDLSTGNLKHISSEYTIVEPPVWSPDGTQIAIRLPKDGVTGNINQIVVLRVNNGGIVYTGRADAQNSPLKDWGTTILSDWSGTKRCENAPKLRQPVSSLSQQPLALDSDYETIRQVLIDSSANWTTIWVNAMITRIDGDTTSIVRAQIWFVDPDKSREIYDLDNDNLADSFIFTNNVLQTIFDLKTGQETTQVLESLSRPPLPILNPGDAFAMNGMESKGGTFQPIGTEIIAGRETLTVEWTDDGGQLKDRLWIDVYTGVVLKWQNLREGYKELVNGQEVLMNAKIEVLGITYDGMFSEDMFNPYVTDEPIYMDVPKTPADQAPVFIPTPGNPDTSLQYGEIYLLNDAQNGQTSMLHFPASCLITGKPCPQPDFISDVPVGFVYPPYIWSPNQTQMVANGSASHVLIFNRDSHDWTQFYYVPYFNFPVWSPDGQWLVGMPEHQISDPSDPLLLVSADGREWEEIMTDQPGTKYPLGWLDKDHILIQNSLDSQKTEEDGSLYDEIQVYNLQTGEVTVIKGIQRDENIFTLTLPTLSPDRTQLAYTMINTFDDSAEVTVIQLETGTETSFAYIPGIASWSPDGNWLSLHTFEDNSCEIHLVRSNGTEAYQLFTGDGCNFVWSPDSQYMLVPALAETGTVPRLYIIPIATGETRLIELPDVGVEFWWPVASWVP